jgi:hypothetical protein
MDILLLCTNYMSGNGPTMDPLRPLRVQVVPASETCRRLAGNTYPSCSYCKQHLSCLFHLAVYPERLGTLIIRCLRLSRVGLGRLVDAKRVNADM